MESKMYFDYPCKGSKCPNVHKTCGWKEFCLLQKRARIDHKRPKPTTWDIDELIAALKKIKTEFGSLPVKMQQDSIVDYYTCYNDIYDVTTALDDDGKLIVNLI